MKDDSWAAIDRTIASGIDNAQMVVLTAELLKEKLEKAQLDDSLRINEDLDFIVSKSAENADFLREIRMTLKKKKKAR